MSKISLTKEYVVCTTLADTSAAEFKSKPSAKSSVTNHTIFNMEADTNSQLEIEEFITQKNNANPGVTTSSVAPGLGVSELFNKTNFSQEITKNHDVEDTQIVSKIILNQKSPKEIKISQSLETLGPSNQGDST